MSNPVKIALAVLAGVYFMGAFAMFWFASHLNRRELKEHGTCFEGAPADMLVGVAVLWPLWVGAVLKLVEDEKR